MTAVTTHLNESAEMPDELLSVARRMLRYLIGGFGDAPDLLAVGPMPTAQRRRLLDWLAPIERLVAYILHVLALDLMKTLSARDPSRKERARAGRSDARTTCPPPDPERPQTWRCSFSACLVATESAADIDPMAPGAEDRINAWYARRDAAGARRRMSGATDHGPPRTLHDPWPLARRIEALVRTVNDPARAVRRLALRYLRAGRSPGFESPPVHRHPWPCSSAINRAWEACRERARTMFPCSLEAPHPVEGVRAGRLPAPAPS